MRVVLGRRFSLLLDLAVSVWVTAWIVFGILAGIYVYRLGLLGSTIRDAATALQQATTTLRPLGRLPFLGGSFLKSADSVAAAARDARANSVTLEHDLHVLGYLLGVALSVIPSLPLLALYIPFRVTAARQRSALRRALEDPTRRAFAQKYLAHRALVDLPYERLLSLGDEPWRDLAQEDLSALVDAQVDFLGLGRHRGERGASPP